MSTTSVDVGSPRPDRRALRRQQTIAEILDIAQQVMTEEGVNGLSISEVARRLGVQPPSLYKYFDSLMALYDALFHRGQIAHLTALQAANEQAEPGLDALHAMLDASGRWSVENNPIAQLMFYRPVPNFAPSDEAMEHSFAMAKLERGALADAVARGQLGPGADSDEALRVVSILMSGALGQTIANEPDVPWGTGNYSSLLPRLIDLLRAVYPPDAEAG